MAIGFNAQFIEGRRNELIFKLLTDTNANIRRSIRQAFFELGRDLKATANKEILRKPKGGRTYFIRAPGGRRRRHVASAPGETHANMTGAARRSIGWQVNGSDSLTFGYGVDPRGPAPDYAEFLEFGTSKMAARPSLQNAMSDVERNAEVYFREAWRDVMPFERL